jgi:hypothetical protein
MMPWEREIYINMLMQHLEEEKERRKAERNKLAQRSRRK